MSINDLLKRAALFIPPVRRIYNERELFRTTVNDLNDYLVHLSDQLDEHQSRLSASSHGMHSVQELVDGLTGKAEHVGAELVEASGRIGNLETQTEQSIEQLSQSREEVERLSRDSVVRSKELESARAHLSTLEGRLEVAEVDLVDARGRVDEIKTQCREAGLATELVNVGEDLKETRARAVDLVSRLKQLDASHVEAKRQEAELQAQLSEAGRGLDEARDKVARLEARLHEANLESEFLDHRLITQSGNYRVHRTEARSVPSATEIEAECERMRSALAKAGQEYKPSEFWEFYYRINLQQLVAAGLHNFKLTISQNYHNYLIEDRHDSKLQKLLKWYADVRDKPPELLFSTIEDPDYLDSNVFQSHPNNQLFDGNRERRVLYRVYVTLLWEFLKSRDQLGLIDRLSEPELGNPIRVTYRDKIISQDLATSALEANDIVPTLKKEAPSAPHSFLEIGAGYGRLAHVLMSATEVDRYVIVDIPPALFVSKWYLAALFPEAKVFGVQDFEDWAAVDEQANQANLIFLLPHQLEMLPDQFVDASISVSSLHEMLPKQANAYLGEMGRVARHLIYSKQYWSYVNPHDELVFEAAQYGYPEAFEEVFTREDPINELFFNKLLRRI